VYHLWRHGSRGERFEKTTVVTRLTTGPRTRKGTSQPSATYLTNYSTGLSGTIPSRPHRQRRRSTRNPKQRVSTCVHFHHNLSFCIPIFCVCVFHAREQRSSWSARKTGAAGARPGVSSAAEKSRRGRPRRTRRVIPTVYVGIIPSRSLHRCQRNNRNPKQMV